MNILFNFSQPEFQIIDEVKIQKWIKNVIEKEKKLVGEISYDIVSDTEILEINLKYLEHDYFTDIITFDSSFVNIISGDIFISFDTVLSNSKKFNSQLITELHRVIIHGIMHLCGYDDYSPSEKLLMRSLEDKYLSYLEEL